MKLLFLTSLLPLIHPVWGSELRSVHRQLTGQVTQLVLIDAGTNKQVATLSNGAVINVATFPDGTSGHFNVEAITEGGDIGSVKFGYNGTPDFRVENAARWALCGNSGDNFAGCNDMVVGSSSTVTATPYSDKRGQGTTGSPLEVSFTIVDETPANEPTELPTKSPTSMPFATGTPIATEPPTKSPTDSEPLATGIAGFKLIYTPTGEEAMDLVDGAIVNVADYAEASFNIEAVAADNVSIKSVTFGNGQKERTAPYSYCGDRSGGVYKTCVNLKPKEASFTVTATVETMSGKTLPMASVTFTIVNGSTPAPIAPPAPQPTALPSTPAPLMTPPPVTQPTCPCWTESDLMQETIRSVEVDHYGFSVYLNLLAGLYRKFDLSRSRCGIESRNSNFLGFNYTSAILSEEEFGVCKALLAPLAKSVFLGQREEATVEGICDCWDPDDAVAGQRCEVSESSAFLGENCENIYASDHGDGTTSCGVTIYFSDRDIKVENPVGIESCFGQIHSECVSRIDGL